MNTQQASTLEERIDVALQPDTAITSADLAALIEEVEAVIAKAGRRPIGRTDPKRHERAHASSREPSAGDARGWHRCLGGNARAKTQVAIRPAFDYPFIGGHFTASGSSPSAEIGRMLSNVR